MSFQEKKKPMKYKWPAKGGIYFPCFSPESCEL